VLRPGLRQAAWWQRVAAILANEALQEIASPGNYYAEPQPSSLTGIFLAISADLGHGTSRLNG